jgi:hypothetical protein
MKICHKGKRPKPPLLKSLNGVKYFFKGGFEGRYVLSREVNDFIIISVYLL